MRVSIRRVLTASAGILLVGAAARAEEPAAPKLLVKHPTDKSFFNGYLAPRIAARLRDDVAAGGFLATGSAPIAARPDDAASARMGRNAVSAATSALQSYALERLNVDAWSIPLLHATGAPRGNSAASVGPRVRFGIAHMTPRAELVMPARDGRFAFSADVRGNLAASFETAGARFRVAASADLPAHDLSVLLWKRF